MLYENRGCNWKATRKEIYDQSAPEKELKVSASASWFEREAASSLDLGEDVKAFREPVGTCQWPRVVLNVQPLQPQPFIYSTDLIQ